MPTTSHRPSSQRDDPVGISDIAAMLDRSRQTIKALHREKRMPEPDGVVSGRPWWYRSRIMQWADQTGRLD